MDELEGLAGSLLGSATGLGGLGGGPSATTATSGGAINADTNINFGSGTIDNVPTITQQQPSTQNTGTPTANTGQVVPNQPVYTVPTYQPGSSTITPTTNKLPLYIGGLILAGVVVFILVNHKPS